MKRDSNTNSYDRDLPRSLSLTVRTDYIGREVLSLGRYGRLHPCMGKYVYGGCFRLHRLGKSSSIPWPARQINPRMWEVKVRRQNRNKRLGAWCLARRIMKGFWKCRKGLFPVSMR